ncbi:hypothetical protein A9R05_16765 [Burkholderia sp. KK1]|nr:hypothetical protein A9R05_16765 [Burkholderia sp. KK1]
MHGLQLILRKRRQRNAHRQVRGDEQQRGEIDRERIADERYVKDETRGEQNDRCLNETDEHVRHDLAGHHFDGAHGCREQVFHRAALAFARHCEARHHDEGHREDDAHQARNDVVLRDALGVVEVMHLDVECGGLAVQRCKRAGEVLAGYGLDQAGQRVACLAHRVRIGGVCFDKQCGPLAAQELAREIGGNVEHEQHAPLRERAAAGCVVG